MSTLFVKIDPIHETPKAYLINKEKGIWIPKSALNSLNISPPYYVLKNWYVNKLRDSCDHKDHDTVLLLLNMHKKVPKDVQEKYFDKEFASLSAHYYDPEPRLWGNECEY
jgi:hypothetical protein